MIIEKRPIYELFSLVKGALRKYDDEGLIDEGILIKEVMYCNDKLGIYLRDIKQCVIPVEDHKAKLPLDFEKLYYVCAVSATNTSLYKFRNPWDNSFDRDVIYEAELDRGSFGGTDHYHITIKREQNIKIETKTFWTELSLSKESQSKCFLGCPNLNRPGKYQVTIEDDFTIRTPFRSGELFLMYIGAMKDEEGNILYPFNPMITPWYEWVLKEKILEDIILNSDEDINKAKVLLDLAKQNRSLAWVDAWNITTEREYNDYAKAQKKKELGWYNKYFKRVKS